MRKQPAVALAFLITCTGVANAADAPQAARYVRFEADALASYGRIEGKNVRRLEGDLFGKWQETKTTYPLADVKLLVPVERPSKVIALAGNYRDHLGTTPVPEHPEPFFKLPSSLIPHEADVIQPADTEPVHYEAELVIVIGRRAKKVPAKEALSYVFGYTCGNDISGRVWQKADRQWWRAKGADTFGPCGPWIATGIDPGSLKLTLKVNDQVKQETSTKEMIHDVAQTVSFISRYVTLEPGDLIYTGTPGKTEPVAVGDVMEVEIEGIGVLRNQVKAE